MKGTKRIPCHTNVFWNGYITTICITFSNTKKYFFFSLLFLLSFVFIYFSIHCDWTNNHKKSETEKWYNSEMLLFNIWDTCTIFLYQVVAFFLFRLLHKVLNVMCECFNIKKNKNKYKSAFEISAQILFFVSHGFLLFVRSVRTCIHSVPIFVSIVVVIIATVCLIVSRATIGISISMAHDAFQ